MIYEKSKDLIWFLDIYFQDADIQHVTGLEEKLEVSRQENIG